MEKRTQAERLSIVEALLVGVNEEIFKGKAEDILQIAVDCQIEINRMVWKLNIVRCGDEAIDADAIIEKLRIKQKWTDYWDEHNYFQSGIKQAIELLSVAPTIDPVKHGKWKKRVRGAELVCSECDGLISMIRVDQSWQPHITTKSLPHNYCPNCGAKMDGGEE